MPGCTMPLEERIERWKAIKRLKAEGKTCVEIGRLYGIDRTRVSHLASQPHPPRRCGPPSKAPRVSRARRSKPRPEMQHDQAPAGA